MSALVMVACFVAYPFATVILAALVITIFCKLPARHSH